MNDKHILESEYVYALKIWKEFNCKTLRDYHDLYLLTDCLLLADIFESFRKTFLSTYKLDPLHYSTLPGLSWDAMLKFTRVKIELIKDPDLSLMIESGIRGGVSMISHRYAKMNLPGYEDYNDTKETCILNYFDANKSLCTCNAKASSNLKLYVVKNGGNG